MRKLVIGTRVRVADCSGVNSNKTGEVIKPVPWRDVPGMYYDPLGSELCVKLDDGHTIYMPKKRLYVI